MNTTDRGGKAERAVAAHLSSLGYEIIELNWKTKFAEIDIAAKKQRTMCFIEVKYRQTSFAGDGFDYITAQKLHHMRRAAESYVLEKGWEGEYILMAASVIGSLDNPKIGLIEV